MHEKNQDNYNGILYQSMLVYCIKVCWYTVSKYAGLLYQSMLVYCIKVCWYTVSKYAGILILLSNILYTLKSNILYPSIKYTVVCKLVLVSCILCPEYFILVSMYPVSCILHPVSCMLYPSILYPVCCILVSCILYAVS